MIAPRASNAFVCLRCELRTVRPRNPRHLPHTTNFSTSLRAQEAREPDAFDEFPETATKPPKSEAPPTPKEPQEPQDALSGFVDPPTKFLRRRGARKVDLAETSVPLSGMKTMGHDSGILVIKEINEDKEIRAAKRQAKAEERKKQKEKIEAAKNSSGLLQDVDFEAERGAASPEEVREILDGMLEEAVAKAGQGEEGGEQYLNKAEFDRLMKGMLKGFTLKQMQGYLAYAMEKRRKEGSAGEEAAGEKLPVEKEPVEKKAKNPYKKPLGRTVWQPVREIRPVGSANKHRAAQTKTGLANQILREAWGIVVTEEAEDLGEIELRLSSWQIGLLNSGSESGRFDKVGKQRRARIEISWPQTVRITAPKTNAEYAADDIEDLLKPIESFRFALKSWVPLLDPSRVQKDDLLEVFPKDFEARVGKLTGTLVKAFLDTNMVQILARNKQDAHEASRMLISLLPLKNSPRRTYEVSQLEAEKDNAYIVPVPFQSSLSSRQKEQALGRWAVTVPKKENTAEEKSTVNGNPFSSALPPKPTTLDPFSQSIHDTVFANLHLPSTPDGTREPNTLWPKPTKLDHHAAYGQELFPDPENSTSPTSSPTTLASTIHRLTTAPLTVSTERYRSIPGVPKIFTDASLKENWVKPSAYLEYQFLVSPVKANKLRADYIYPKIKIRLSLRDTRHPVLRDVRLTYGDSSHTVLMPREVSDIRFNSEMTTRMHDPSLYPSIKQFSDAVIRDIANAEGKLNVPPNIDIEIPTWTILPADLTEPININKHYNDGEDVGGVKVGTSSGDLRKFTYVFTGVTHAQHFSAEFEGHSVGYSLRSGGKLGDGANGIGTLNLYYNKPYPSKKRTNAKAPPSSSDTVEKDGADALEALSGNAPAKTPTNKEEHATNDNKNDTAPVETPVKTPVETETSETRGYINTSFRLLSVISRAAQDMHQISQFYSEEAMRGAKAARAKASAEGRAKAGEAKKSTAFKSDNVSPRNWGTRPIQTRPDFNQSLLETVLDKTYAAMERSASRNPLAHLAKEKKENEDLTAEDAEWKMSKIGRTVRGLGRQVWGDKVVKTWPRDNRKFTRASRAVDVGDEVDMEDPMLSFMGDAQAEEKGEGEKAEIIQPGESIPTVEETPATESKPKDSGLSSFLEDLDKKYGRG